MDRQILALQIFRSRYGIWANPEDHPILWTTCLELADEQIYNTVDEGGES